MVRKKSYIAAVAALFAVVLTGMVAQAQPTVDGTLDPSYGTALSVQAVETQFGDNSSELNAAYAQISGGNLYLMFTGNLENNFNKLMVFVDSVSGGQNSIDSTNNPQNFDSNIGEGFGNGWAPYTNRDLADSPAPLNQAQEGSFTFDAGFEADYAMLFRRGAGKFDFDFAEMNQTVNAADEIAEAFGAGNEEGSSGDLSAAAGNNSGTAFQVGFNNANTAGVAGGTGAADQAAAMAVTTGIEIAIPLSALGNPTDDIKVSAFINGSNHDYVSNQFLGSLTPDQANIGQDGFPGTTTPGNFFNADRNLNGEFDSGDDYDGDLADGPGGLGPDALGVGLVDLNNFDGDQFFTIPNTPALEDADFNGDGDVDGSDYLVWQRGFGIGSSLGEGDANGSGTVDSADLAIWQNQYDGNVPALTAVPEPTSLLLVGLGVAGSLLARKRRV